MSGMHGRLQSTQLSHTCFCRPCVATCSRKKTASNDVVIGNSSQGDSQYIRSTIRNSKVLLNRLLLVCRHKCLNRSDVTGFSYRPHKLSHKLGLVNQPIQSCG